MAMRILLPSIILLLAACSTETEPTANSTAAEPPSREATAPVEAPSSVAAPMPLPAATPVVVPPADSDGDSSATKGGDGSPITLAALRPEDGGRIEGELACEFVRRSGHTIFLALGDVVDTARAQGVYRVGDYAEVVVMNRTGGFNAMSAGATFGGRGMTLTIDRGERIATDSEQTSHVATLRAQRADGAEREYDGSWTCGP